MDRAARVVSSVMPQIAVRDDDELIVTYLPAGSIGKRRSGDRSGGPRGRQLVRWDGGHEDWTWRRTNVLLVHRPSDPFSYWCAWGEDGALAWWYVNLEDPWRRTAIGFDSRDHDLDLYAEPDRTQWHWKDDDELEWAVAHGRFTLDQAREIRANGERALEIVRANQPPYDGSWAAWRPEPTWPIPRLPENWRAFDP